MKLTSLDSPSEDDSPAARTVTLRDIARVTGLHYSTVSLALRGSPRLSPATREKIQETARQLGYRPDPMLVALNAYRRARDVPHYQATIAWLNNWPQRERLYDKSDFFEYYCGAGERATQLGYVLEEFWLHSPGMTSDKLCRILRARNLQAVLLPPQPQPNTEPVIPCTDFSVVSFGYSIQPAVLNVVANHQFHSMSLMIRHLLELGYQRLGLCIPAEMDDKAESNYLSGMLMTQWKNPGLPAVPPLLLRDDRRESSDGLLRQWLDTHRPDVVIGLAYLAPRLQELGFAIPERVGFANLSVSEDNEYWSGTHQNNRMIGRKAVDLVVGMLHRGERGVPEVPVRTLVESSWMPGSTVRPQPPAHAPGHAAATGPRGKRKAATLIRARAASTG